MPAVHFASQPLRTHRLHVREGCTKRIVPETCTVRFTCGYSIAASSCLFRIINLLGLELPGFATFMDPLKNSHVPSNAQTVRAILQSSNTPQIYFVHHIPSAVQSVAYLLVLRMFFEPFMWVSCDQLGERRENKTKPRLRAERLIEHGSRGHCGKDLHRGLRLATS